MIDVLIPMASIVCWWALTTLVGCFVFTPLLLVIIPSKVFLKELIHADPLNHGFPMKPRLTMILGSATLGKPLGYSD
jgi:hypothetical protein